VARTLDYARIRLSRLAKELANLPRTFTLVHQASGHLTTLWGLLLVTQGLLPVATVYLTRAIVNSLVAAIRSGGQWNALRPVIVLAAWIGAIMLATQLLRVLTAWVRTAQSEMVRDYLASLLQKKSLEVDLAFYDSSDFYDHLHRARMEATHRPIELLEGLGSLLQGGITLIVILGILIPFGLLPPLALLLSTVPALYLLVEMAQRRHRWEQSTTVENRRSWYYDTLLTEAESAAELRLFDLGDYFLRAFRKTRLRLRHERLSLARQESLSELWAGGVALVVLAGTMAWMVLRAIHGLASLGDLALFYQAFNQGFGLSRTLLDNLGKIYENSLFLGNLFEFLDLKPQIVSAPHARSLPSCLSSGLKFERVSFRYPGSNRQALCNFSLDISPGQTVALVGPNGTGKSTLIKLLCRFYDPDSGSISIDNIPLREFSISELRRSMSVFFQQPVCYNDTVAANIRYGDLRLTDSEFSSALRTSADVTGLNEIIARLPNDYETQLGRGFQEGTELSVGEWQRLALARATVRQAQVLILDEPTSAMDPWAELRWAERLHEIAANRITILITHRFTTAMFADVIHVMSEGSVVESGSHGELIARGGIYAKGWAAQARV
jgi:ATP-binding cassette, subfamily B, bacterial